MPPKKHLLHLILLCFIGSGLSCGVDRETPPQKIFEVRFVQDEKTPESQEYILIEQRNGERIEETLFLEKESLLPAAPILGALAFRDQHTGEYKIGVKLTPAAAKKMADLSRNYRQRRIALLIDDRVITAPVMNEEIPGEFLQIRAYFSQDEAEKLAKRIRQTAQELRP